MALKVSGKSYYLNAASSVPEAPKSEMHNYPSKISDMHSTGKPPSSMTSILLATYLSKMANLSSTNPIKKGYLRESKENALPFALLAD